MPSYEHSRHWEAAIAVLTVAGMPVAAATKALRTITGLVCLRTQTTLDGVQITTPQLYCNSPGLFERYLDLPTEIRQMIWRESIPLAPRILTYERKRDDTTTFDVNLFSRAQSSIAAVCSESREIFLENRGRMYADNRNGILAVSPSLDIIHLGPEFEMRHLELLVEKIGRATAREVRHLILEYQIENAHGGNGGLPRVFAPRFFEICSLLPELRRIIFVSHDRDRGSNTLTGDLIFTSHDSTSSFVINGRTFKEFAESQFPFYLKRQLEVRRMDNIRPTILFMEPVEVSTERS
jgi:hypothetical protein